ncbi:MAG: hypothetical protein AAB600_01260 [Patescibacteria group bacterium]
MLRQVFILIFLIFLFILFHKPAFAALTITDVSPVSISSPENVITITATASGLQNTTQYLQVGLTKGGEVSNYFGFTKNQSEEWFKYKSLPSPSDLSSYFYKFTPVGGAWSGQILAKVDIEDTGYKGSGNYTIKLIKYITSSASYSSNSATITVNIAPTSTPIPTNTPTPSPTNTPVPTKTPTPSPTKSPTPTLKPTSALVIPTSIEPTDEAIPTSVLGESTESEIKEDDKPSKTKPVEEAKILGIQADNLSKILISIGAILLLACGILIFRTYMRSKKDSGEV